MIPCISKVDFSQLRVSCPRSNINGGQTVCVCNATNEKYIFNLVGCETKRGFTSGANTSLQLETKNIMHVDCLDTFILNHAVENSLEWFGQSLDREALRRLYKPTIHDSSWRVRVPVDEGTGTFIGSIFNIKNEKIHMNHIMLEDETFDAIIQLSGIYFIPGEFGPSWKLLQIKVRPRVALSTCAFHSDDDDMSDAEPN
jgi:hypothetical protein